MDINDWVARTPLESPITEHALLLFGRKEGSNNPIGTAVFIASGLAITAKHVVEEFWRLYGTPHLGVDRPGERTATGEVMAIQYQGERSTPAIWLVRTFWLSLHSDLAAISLEPVDELSRSYRFTSLPRLSILPPNVGTRVAAFGYANSSVLEDRGVQIDLALNPVTSPGVVAEVYPEYRDRSMLSFPCFRIDTVFIGGMSGGPIFSESGDLCGLVCAGQEGWPIAYGVALWPLLLLQITHQIEGTVIKGPYQIFELATIGHLYLKDFDQVFDNVEAVEEPFAKPRIRLKDPRSPSQ